MKWVYWTPPLDWASCINLFARYQRGITQLFDKYPNCQTVYQRFLTDIKQKSTIDLRELIINQLVAKGKTFKRAKEIVELNINVMKIVREQEQILNNSLINPNTGKWERNY